MKDSKFGYQWALWTGRTLIRSRKVAQWNRSAAGEGGQHSCFGATPLFKVVFVSSVPMLKE